ncbi:MAG: hypothetical protein R3245_04150 [Kiloniellales bacterium]|nr:hypothetical protein [Kiloniellales bacterium]
MSFFRSQPGASALSALLFLALPALGLAAQGIGLNHEEEYGACLRLSIDDPEQALQSALIWKDQGGDAPAEHCAALALISLGRYGEAGDRLLELADNLESGRVKLRAEVLAQAAQARFLSGDLSDAARIQGRALDLAPDNIELWIDRALTLAANQQYWEAIDDLNEANTLDASRSDVLIYRANAYRHLETYELAMEDIATALSLEPDNVDALLERGNLFRLLGQEEAARDDWVRVTTQAPDSPAAAAAQTNLEMLDVRIE